MKAAEINKLLKRAEVIACATMSGIPRNYGDDTNQYDHSRRVASRAASLYNTLYPVSHILKHDRDRVHDAPKTWIIGILHDLIEDTEWTEDQLAREFPAEIMGGVRLLTRYPGTVYFDYIRAIADSGSDMARLVKLADLADNTGSGDTPESLDRRHNKAREIILSSFDDRQREVLEGELVG